MENPIRNIRVNVYGASVSDMCQALGVSQSMLSQSEKGLHPKAPAAVLEGLKAMGHDPERVAADYAAWYKAIQGERRTQLQQVRADEPGAGADQRGGGQP